MKITGKRVLSGILAVCMAASLFCVNAFARTSAYLDAYGAAVTPVGRGKVVITIDVDAVVNAKKLGASTIYLYESKDGSTFYRIKTYEYEDYPIMMGSGWHYYKDVATYTGTAGYDYYAIVYCYAEDSTGHDEKSYITSTVTAT